MKALLVTGTDTGVGKTFVTCGLAAALRVRGLRVGVMKPAETGCARRNGVFEPEDAARLKLYSGCELPLDQICPYRFSAPRAPWVAAQAEHIEIELCRLTEVYRKIQASHDITLVEGAGGLLVPLRRDFHYADLAREWNLPVLVVTTSKLGTLNHTALTLSYLRQAGLGTVGYVVNTHEPTPPELAASNLETLRALTPESCLGQVPHQNNFIWGNAPIEQLAALFEASLNWQELGKELALDLPAE